MCFLRSTWVYVTNNARPLFFGPCASHVGAGVRLVPGCLDPSKEIGLVQSRTGATGLGAIGGFYGLGEGFQHSGHDGSDLLISGRMLMVSGDWDPLRNGRVRIRVGWFWWTWIDLEDLTKRSSVKIDSRERLWLRCILIFNPPASVLQFLCCCGSLCKANFLTSKGTPDTIIFWTSEQN